jgi:hypothetical protein
VTFRRRKIRDFSRFHAKLCTSKDPLNIFAVRVLTAICNVMADTGFAASACSSLLVSGFYLHYQYFVGKARRLELW